MFANVDPTKGYKGITAFLVERSFPGFSVGKKENKLGIRASSTCELVLEDCEVPEGNVIGEVGKGYKIAIETLNEGRIGIGAQMLGLAAGAFDHAMRYMRRAEAVRAADRRASRACSSSMRASPWRSRPRRLLVYNAARLKDAGQPFVKEAAMAKLFASEVAERAASLCIEFIGGVGFTQGLSCREATTATRRSGRSTRGRSNMQLSTIAKLI